MILKPLAILDEAFQWVIDHVHSEKKNRGGKKRKGGGKGSAEGKPFDVEAI